MKNANVRGDVVNLLVRFRVMNIGKALLSTQDLSRCGWETVFPADCGNAYLVTRMTLVKAEAHVTVVQQFLKMSRKASL